MDKITLPDAAVMFGVNATTLNEWVRGGVLKASGGGRQGCVREFSLTTALAIGICRSLRQQGATIASLAPIGQFLGKLSIDQLESAFYRGQTLLIAADGLPPQLAAPGDVICHRQGAVELLARVDLEAAYRILLAGLKQFRETQAVMN